MMNVKEFMDKINRAYNDKGVRFVIKDADLAKTLKNGYDVYRVHGKAVYPEFLKNDKWYSIFPYVVPCQDRYADELIEKLNFLVDVEESFINEDEHYYSIKNLVDEDFYISEENKSDKFLYDVIFSEKIERLTR